LDSNWNKIWFQAVKNNDPKASALLDLKREIGVSVENLSSIKKDAEEKLGKLGEEGVRFGKNLKDYKNELNKINNFLIAVLLFVSITFIVTTISLFWSGILSNKDEREIYLRYDDIYKNYSDQVEDLKSILNQQKLESNDLKNEINNLKAAKNTYLK